jgi:hypothetical protein
VLAAVLVGAASNASAIMDATTECLAEFDGVEESLANGGALTCDDCDPACDDDGQASTNGACTFNLRVCLNQAEGTCEAGDLRKVKVKKVSGNCKVTGLKPTPSGTSSVCGAFTNLTVKLKKKGQKPGKCKIQVMTSAKSRPKRVDKDTLTLTCNPQPSSCPTTTTSTSSTVTTTSTTSTTIDCCSSGTQLEFVTDPPSATVSGTVQSTGSCSAPDPAGTPCDSDADCTDMCNGPPVTTLNLTSGGLYFGGNGVGVPLPNQVPDLGVSLLNITSCAAGEFDLAATDEADVGGDKPWRRCTSGPSVQSPEYPGKPGCLFGPPLPIPNGATSVCIVNRVSADAAGGGTCGGATNDLALPLFSDLYLTGPTLGDAPCPRCLDGGGTCSPGTNCCESGPNVNQPCVPGSTLTGVSHPTSHDCPPPDPYIGSLPIPFNLGTGTQTKTATDFLAMNQVFCGFCGRSSGSQPYDFRGVCTGGTEDGKTCNSGVCANCVTTAACVAAGGSCAPTACTADADCSSFTAGCGNTSISACNRCRQRTSGAFGAGQAQTITENGSPADGVGTDPRPATLVSVFCIPPSFNGTVDANGDLPGPGAVSLPGKVRLLP